MTMTKQTVKTTGWNAQAPNNFIVDAGALFKDVQYNSTQKRWEGVPLGATSGGSSVSIEIETEDIEVDGVKADTVGTKVLTSVSASIEANFKQVTAENVRLGVIGTSKLGDGETAPATATVVTGSTRIRSSDYIQNVALVGKYSGSDEPVIVILDNALSTEGISFDTEDNNQAIVTMTFKAHATAEQNEKEEVPWRIIFPQVTEMPTA